MEQRIIRVIWAASTLCVGAIAADSAFWCFGADGSDKALWRVVGCCGAAALSLLASSDEVDGNREP